jgi:hypothetical protein
MGIVRIILLVLLLAYSLQSQAATIHTDTSGTTLLGFYDVSVDGALYDVTFVDGTYNAVFGAQPLSFSGLTEAYAASDALEEAIAQYPTWDDHSAGTPIGIASSSNIWGFFIPYEITQPDQVSVLSLLHKYIAPGISSPHLFVGLATSYDTTDLTGSVWARWERVNAVPIPAAVWLFGSGLLGLIGLSKRKKVT